MRESVLYYIWEYQLFNQDNLQTTNQKSLRILKTGKKNYLSGPDYEEATVKINELLLCGKVEIHIRASDWKRHNHHYNKNYDQVILHVVWEHDISIFRTDNTEIPTLELKNIVSNRVIEQAKLFKVKDKPACSFSIGKMNPNIIINMYEKAIIERLNRKKNEIEILFNAGMPGEEVLYLVLVRNFGFKHNKIAFNMLGNALPYRLLRKHLNHPHQIFAMILGQSGFLDTNLENEYERELHNEYLYLAHKYDLLSLKIKEGVFKTGGIRPPNQPKLRLKQLANLLMNFSNLYNTLSKPFTKPMYYKLFYSNFVYEYSLPKSFENLMLPKNSIHNLLINTVIPFRYYYENKYKGGNIAEVLSLLLSLPKENNYITNRMENAGFINNSALDSQCLLEIWENYCNISKCLKCKIGINIIRKVSNK